MYHDYSAVDPSGRPATERLAEFDAGRFGPDEPPARVLLRRVVEERMDALDLEGAGRSLDRLSDAYGEDATVAELRRRLAENAARGARGRA